MLGMRFTEPWAYLVIKKANGDFWTFDTAHETAVFMWGRDFEEYLIYKRVEWSDGDLHRFEGALDKA